MTLNKNAFDYARDALGDYGANVDPDHLRNAIEAYLFSVAAQASPQSEVHRWARQQTRATMTDMLDKMSQGLADGITDMVSISHGISVASGWYDDPATGWPCNRNFGERIALIHSELSEALEGHRKNKMDDHLPERVSAEVEIADALHRICDLAGELGIDPGAAYVEKAAYNLRREDHKMENRKAEGGKAY